MVFTLFRTRMGWVGILASDCSLLATTLPMPTRAAALAALPGGSIRDATSGENPLVRRARARMERYFAGKRVAFDDLPIDESRGTVFQRRVWRLTRKIEYGRVRTYRELACGVGRSHAARAIGQCMAKNPLPIIVPCHRVVGQGGNLRGFGGGLAMKRRLLIMEGAL